MKFISYSHNGEHKFGILDNDLITDLTGKISGATSLKDLILKKGIAEAKKYASSNPGNLSVKDIEYLPLIPNPGKIICVGLNYSEHVKETNRTVEENPVIFHRFPESQTAHLQSIQRPIASDNLDFKGKLFVIFNVFCKHHMWSKTSCLFKIFSHAKLSSMSLPVSYRAFVITRITNYMF